MLTVKLHYLYRYFLAQLALQVNDLQSTTVPLILLFSSLFTSCPHGRKIAHQEDLGEVRASFCLMPVRNTEGERATLHAVPQFSGGLWQMITVTDKSTKADALVLMRNGHLYKFMHKFHDLPLSDTDFKELE